jgi:hypothetical protein
MVLTFSSSKKESSFFPFKQKFFRRRSMKSKTNVHFLPNSRSNKATVNFNIRLRNKVYFGYKTAQNLLKLAAKNGDFLEDQCHDHFFLQWL